MHEERIEESAHDSVNNKTVTFAWSKSTDTRAEPCTGLCVLGADQCIELEGLMHQGPHKIVDDQVRARPDAQCGTSLLLHGRP